MRRRLWAVLVAVAFAAAAPAATIIGGGSPADASSGPTAAGAKRGAVDATQNAAANNVDGAAGPTGAAATTGAGSRTSSVARATTTAKGTASSTRAPTDGGPGGTTTAPSGALRDLAARRGVRVGASVLTSNNLTDSQYASVLGSEYSMLTPENDMKWSAIEPEPGVYDFVAPDVDVSFAASHGMAVRGHNLAWGVGNPTWLTAVPYTRDQLIAILHDHISTVVGHYRGKVAQWDVVNEGLDGGFWQDHIGSDYIDMAFRWAHDADPGAKLFYNDYGAEGLGGRSDAVYNLVRGLRQRGVPIDGVGLESHFDLSPPAMRDVAANMRRLNGLGLETAITEVDVRLKTPPTSEELDRQRVVYNGLLHTCLAAANCKTFVSWGFTDKTSWVPSSYPGYGAALPFDASYNPKPAYFGLRAALGG